MTLRSDRHLATLCSTTVLLLRGRLVDKAPGARLLIKARALHSDAHRRSRIYGRNRIAHSNLRQVLAPRLGPYMVERRGFELPVRFGPVSTSNPAELGLAIGEKYPSETNCLMSLALGISNEKLWTSPSSQKREIRKRTPSSNPLVSCLMSPKLGRS